MTNDSDYVGVYTKNYWVNSCEDITIQNYYGLFTMREHVDMFQHVMGQNQFVITTIVLV